jgi:hypothetical protein
MRLGRSGSNVQGADSVKVGLLALAVALVSGVVFPIALRRTGRSDGIEVLYLGFGALMGLASLSFLLHGGRGLREEARRRRVRAARPDEPWLADHPWRPDRAPDDGAAEVGRWLWTAGFLAAFLAVLAVPVLVAWPGEGRLPAGILLGVLGLSVPAAAGRGLYLLARRARHGRSELRFLGFPFFLGDALEAELVRPRGGPSLGRVEATLRCVQERYVRAGVTSRKQTLLDLRVLHEQKAVVEAAGDRLRLPLRFRLPDDGALATALAENPPRYWEIAVASAVPGVDFGATFLVPVYARDPGTGPRSEWLPRPPA